MNAKLFFAIAGLAALLGAPTAAGAQFAFPNGYFSARPFAFRTFGVRPVLAQPFGFGGFFASPSGFFVGSDPFTVNQGPLGGLINGQGPIATGFNSSIFPGGVIFPGPGTALNPGFDPRFGNQALIMSGQVPANMTATFGNQAALNPFFSPNGGFIPPSADMVGAPGFVQTGTPVIDPALSTPVAPVSQLVTSAIEGGRLVIRYHGDTSVVKSITFSLLDKLKRPLKVQIINRQPAEARMTLTSATEFFRVNVEYLDGRNQVIEGAV